MCGGTCACMRYTYVPQELYKGFPGQLLNGQKRVKGDLFVT